jgi:esterase/lipase superfamily enzyme
MNREYHEAQSNRLGRSMELFVFGHAGMPPLISPPPAVDFSYVLTTGWYDQCLAQNQQLDRILSEKGIPHQFHVWDAPNAHDWPTWQRMVRQYL